MHYALLIMNSIVVIVKTIMHYALLIMNSIVVIVKKLCIMHY